MLPQTVHLWMFGPVPLPEALARLVRTGADGRIGGFHVADNDGRPSSSGALDWRGTLAALLDAGFDGPLSHEPMGLGYSEAAATGDPGYRRRFESQLATSISFLKRVMAEILPAGWIRIRRLEPGRHCSFLSV